MLPGTTPSEYRHDLFDGPRRVEARWRARPTVVSSEYCDGTRKPGRGGLCRSLVPPALLCGDSSGLESAVARRIGDGSLLAQNSSGSAHADGNAANPPSQRDHTPASPSRSSGTRRDHPHGQSSILEGQQLLPYVERLMIEASRQRSPRTSSPPTLWPGVLDRRAGPPTSYKRSYMGRDCEVPITRPVTWSRSPETPSR